MLEKIPKRLEIPKSLRTAASIKNVVPFIGAGVSNLLGYPDWEKLANEALRFFIAKKELNHAQFDQISESRLSPRVKLSLAVNIEKNYRKRAEREIDFEQILTQKIKKEQGGNDIYKYILQLFHFSRNFVTTNYDVELDDKPLPVLPKINEENASERPSDKFTIPIYERNKINASALDRNNTVIHIHGSIRDRRSMVLTTSDYLARYANHQVDGPEPRENEFLSFLEQLFKSRNVLFIGYGLQELEILEYVIQKGFGEHSAEGPDTLEKHYIIQGFFSHNLELANSLESYFRSLGIKLLPFSLDEHGWDGLTDVIKYLIRELPSGEQLKLTEFREMANLLPSK